jgi:hypothetical protein
MVKYSAIQLSNYMREATSSEQTAPEEQPTETKQTDRDILKKILDKVDQGGLPPGGGDLEVRVVALETSMGYIKKDISKINTDITKIREDIKNDFWRYFSVLVIAVLGLAGMMAKGFNWF